ncbi:serine/threonine-protein kinase [Parasphingorhabdus sp.]|uniref:serine/threonine-protein kinase n=1 Tax=Parasphingorhabdus sp. TaxID=2709688 RepID=UPI003A8DE06C
MNRHDPETERSAIAALEEALDQPSDKRLAYLESCASLSEAARARALTLLAASRSSAPGLMTGGASQVLEDEAIPDMIGAYRILRLIGRGGMGNVYLAERAAQDFDHAVAIKLIKKRLITPLMVDRFRRERQILADLNHPGIARLFDGGETPDGAPYFVMEFVDGVPLGQWLTTKPRSLQTRLQVFRQICVAVEAAHQRLIIHRDLTPSNILVTDHDAVKVIDFGIARSEHAESEEEDEKQLGHTPGFAAPELRSGGNASTLTDVYALGKLLSRLLEESNESELQAIAHKASAEKTEDRYPSVSALIEDIDNFTDLRPVSAVGGGLRYAAGKFARRQKLLVGTAAFTAFALTGALIFVTHSYREAEIAHFAAEQSLADTRELASTMMFDIFDEVSSRPGNSQARLLLARSAQKYLDELASDPTASPSARLAAGRGFARLAEATGSFGSGNSGDISKGMDFYQRSARILEQLYADAPDDKVALALAQTLVSLARDKLQTYTDPAGSVSLLERARKLLLSVNTPDSTTLAELGRAERYLGDALICCNSREDAGIKAIRRGLEAIDNAPEQYRSTQAVRRSYNDLLNLNAGIEIWKKGDKFGIEPFRAALSAQRQLAEETGSPEDYQLEATIASNLARTLLRMGQINEAWSVMETAHARNLKAYNADPDDNDLQRRLAITSIVMGRIAAEGGKRAEASRLIARGMHLARQGEWPEGVETVPSLNYAHRLHEASQAYWINDEKSLSCRLTRDSIALYAAYAEQYDLPAVSLKYRLAPLQERARLCPKASQSG